MERDRKWFLTVSLEILQRFSQNLSLKLAHFVQSRREYDPRLKKTTTANPEQTSEKENDSKKRAQVRNNQTSDLFGEIPPSHQLLPTSPPHSIPASNRDL